MARRRKELKLRVAIGKKRRRRRDGAGVINWKGKKDVAHKGEEDAESIGKGKEKNCVRRKKIK